MTNEDKPKRNSNT